MIIKIEYRNNTTAFVPTESIEYYNAEQDGDKQHLFAFLFSGEAIHIGTYKTITDCTAAIEMIEVMQERGFKCTTPPTQREARTWAAA